MRGWYKDYEFSRRTMRERWAKGRSDTQLTLAASPWPEPAPPEVGLELRMWNPFENMPVKTYVFWFSWRFI